MPELSEAAQKQGELWGKHARDWFETQEAIDAEVRSAALSVLGAGPGVSILDCGCGAGGALVEAASRGATPAGFDPSVNMLTIARERLPTADLRIAELGSIPWSNASFDGVMSLNSLQFVEDPQLGLHEMGRVCCKDGAIVVAVWDDMPVCDLGRIAEAIQGLFPKRPRSRGPFNLSAPGVLESLFGTVPDIRLERIDLVPTCTSYASLDAAVRGQMSAGATERAVEILGEQRVRGAVESAVRAFVQPDGSVELRNRCRIALARSAA